MTIQDTFGDSGIATPYRAASAKAKATAKRALDLALAFTAILFCLPVFALITLAIALDSRGPVLFCQRRAGLGGRPFGIYKFRTMHVLEDGESIVQAQPNDTRITRVGHFLRISSLDELPQLFNVVSGEMSLVGPRPHALAHDNFYAGLIENYAERRRVKPGITGWAQIQGARGATPTLEIMRSRVAFDLWYARHASLALDLEIILRTPLEVIRPRNAV